MLKAFAGLEIKEEAINTWRHFNAVQRENWAKHNVQNEEQFVSYILNVFDHFEKLPLEKQVKAIEDLKRNMGLKI